MQIRTMKLMLAVLGAMSMVLTGCPDGGRESLACTDNTECIEGEICHPTAKVCVQTCTASADCPESSKACEAISATNAQKICQCSTKELCQRDERVSDASNLECTAAKVCAPPGTTPACTKNEDCTGGQTCDVTSGTCKAPTTCQGTGQSTCGYGQFCNNNTCAAAPVAEATCENFSQNRPAWSPSTSNGPVIYSVERTGYQVNSSFCQASAPDAFLVRVRAYRTDADWPSTRAGLSGFFYVTTGAQQFDIVNQGLLVPNTGYNRNTSNLKDADFTVYLCRPSNSQTIQTGFYFTGGNPVCSQISR
jgi:hypothetical protein